MTILTLTITTTTTTTIITTTATITTTTTITNTTTIPSTSSDYTLKALKPISDEYKLIAEKIIDSFTGDASFFAYNGEEAAEDPEGPPVERFREQDRLSYTVLVTTDNNSNIDSY